MATLPAVSSHPSTPLQQVERESIQHVKTTDKEKPIADTESSGSDVTSSGPEETADVVVSEKESPNDSVPEVEKADVSGGTGGDQVNKDLEKDKEESEAGVIKAESELKPTEEIPEENQNIESSESLDAAGKEDHVEVKDLPEKIEVPDVTEVTDVGKNDFSEEKAHVIQELEKEFAETEAADKIEVDAAKDEQSVGLNEDFSEEKAHVIQELEKEFAENEAAEKIKVDAAKDEQSGVESGLEPIGIEKPKQDDGITTTEEAHVEQKDRDFQPEAVIDTESESNTTKKVAPDEENEVQKEEDTVVNKEISDVSETEQTSKEIELPTDLEGDKDETVAATDKDVIEVEKNVDAQEPHKPETGTEAAEVSDKIDVDASKDEDDLNEKVDANNSTDVEPVATEQVTEVPTPEAEKIIDTKEENVVGNNDESPVPEVKGIKEETNKTELPESEAEVNETKENLEGIEPSGSLDDVAKESSEKTEILESSMPEASNVELEQSEAEITEVKEVGNPAAKDEKNEDLSNGKDETTKESVETGAVDKFEIDGAKDEKSQANKLEGFELKSESVPEEPIATTDDSNVKIAENIDTENKKEDTAVVEAKGNSDVSETSRDIELPTDIEGKKHETLASIFKNEKDIEVEKKIDAEESLESETGTKRDDFSDVNTDIAEGSKVVVATESTEKTDIDAAKEEPFLPKEVEEPVAGTEDTNAKHIETETPTSETEQNIDIQDPIKAEDDTNSIKTSATDAESEEKKEDSVVPEAKKVKETTQVSNDVSKVDETSREIQLPADLGGNKGESLATNEEPQESKTETIEGGVEENAKLDAPNEESDDVKTTEEAPKDEEVVPKQKQSNNLLSKVKQSLVKAKKAIIKKTPSKTPPTS